MKFGASLSVSSPEHISHPDYRAGNMGRAVHTFITSGQRRLMHLVSKMRLHQLS